MTIQVNIAEAEGKLAELIARVEAGEEVVLARDGAPIARLSPAAHGVHPVRKFGMWKHLFPPDYRSEDALDDEDPSGWGWVGDGPDPDDEWMSRPIPAAKP